jgi:2-polyprenyl-6-hydroxyphenyl methylase/3-demethylubiquinone-9 3-methyltransferase
MSSATTPTSSVLDAEVEKFSALAAEWWDPHGKFRTLHTFNPVRLTYIREQVCAHFHLDADARRPFEGLRFLDIGCGGGLLCEPVTRLGADVMGADASEKNVRTAQAHAREHDLNIDYRACTAEQLAAADEAFDVILNMEVVEHVANVDAFIATCAAMVKPGGMMITATLNRTLKSFALAIVGAEYVLGWLPRGTHNWEQFVTPSELGGALTAGGLEPRHTTGVTYNPLSDTWQRSTDTGVNYLMLASRPSDAAD